ncbi:MAG: hypothetical protein LBR31_07385 [Desulfovibrio sp.]|jgi:hypothetical protein|nr:hypothetical protein [Desulfovibrio sp.]
MQTQALASSRHMLMQYQKNLVTSRLMSFHQETLNLMEKEQCRNPEAKRQLVIRRVARDLWTNFTVRGEDTPMLRHLCQRLCCEYGEELRFQHQPGGYELIILRRTDEGFKPVSGSEKIDMVNRAWKIALDVVSSYVR